MGMYSLDAMYLMLRTATTESKLTHLRQLPNGPALGFMQIEPDTFFDTQRYLNGRPDLRKRVLEYCNYEKFPVNINCLIHDLAFNAIIARVKYWMNPEPIPSYNNIEAQGEYYLRHYNTSLGKATLDSFMKAAEYTDGCIQHPES